MVPFVTFILNASLNFSYLETVGFSIKNTAARAPGSGYQIIHALKSSCSLDWQAIFKKGLAIGAWAKELVCVRSLKKTILV